MFRPDDHRGRRRRYLLDLSWAGRTVRLAQEQATATFDGDELVYLEGLDLDERIDLGSSVQTGGADPLAVSATLHLEGIVDLIDLLDVGHDIGAATAKLWTWLDGTTDRVLLLDGVVEDPIVAPPQEAPATLICTLRDTRAEVALLWPPDLAVVDATSWPSSADKSIGESYPWILGQPGDSTTGAAGSPGLVLSVHGGTTPERVLCAGHPVEASTVTVVDHKGDTATIAITEEDDGRGRKIARTNIHGSSLSSSGRIEDPYWLIWAGGGLRWRGSTLTGAGDVIEWALEQSGVTYDRGRLASVGAELNRYQIDGYILPRPGERLDLWDWCQRAILPLLPVSIAMGPGGLHLILWRWDASASDAVAHLRATDGCERLSAIEFTRRSDVVNELTIAYAVRAQDGKATQRLTIGGRATLDADNTARLSWHCDRSIGRHGRRPATLASRYVWQAATAARILGWRALALSDQAWLISYACPPGDVAHLERGDVVELTDSEIGASAWLCLVVGTPQEAGEWIEVSLRRLQR